MIYFSLSIKRSSMYVHASFHVWFQEELSSCGSSSKVPVVLLSGEHSNWKSCIWIDDLPSKSSEICIMDYQLPCLIIRGYDRLNNAQSKGTFKSNPVRTIPQATVFCPGCMLNHLEMGPGCSDNCI